MKQIINICAAFALCCYVSFTTFLVNNNIIINNNNKYISILLWWWSWRGPFGIVQQTRLPLAPKRYLLGWGVLGHSLGALADGMLGQLARQKQTDRSLDFAAGDGMALVVVRQSARLSCDALENVIHERVHDGHSFRADTSVRVHLLQHLVDIDAIGFGPLLLPLAAGSSWTRANCSFFAGLFALQHLRRHDFSRTRLNKCNNNTEAEMKNCHFWTLFKLNCSLGFKQVGYIAAECESYIAAECESYIAAECES